MYLEYYGLRTNPFQITVDPDLVYLSQSHARAKAYMSYSIWKWDGFSIITGKPGTGKTLMAKNLISRLKDDITVVYLNHTRLSSKEFLRSLAANLGIHAFNAEKAELIYRITEFLKQQYEAKKRVLLVIDEAHYLSPGIIEEIRFLTALEKDKAPLLNIILVGDDQLLVKFDGPGMDQLRQRVRLWYSLSNLDKNSVKEYINYRLAVSGRETQGIFTDSAISLIHSFTDGTPRLVNVICDAAMIAAYVKEDGSVSAEHVRTALDELKWDQFTGKLVMESKQKRLNRPAGAVASLEKKKLYPKIEVSSQGLLMAELVLDKKSVSIGCEKSNDFMFEDPSVCGHHAVISRLDGEYLIEDLDSLNGTYVNARKIKSHVLQHGDTIGITSYQIRFSRGEPEVSDNLVSEVDKSLGSVLSGERYEHPRVGRLAI